MCQTLHSPLPLPARNSPRRYVQWIEDRLGVHCKWIGVGPGRDAVVEKPVASFVAAKR